MLLNKRVELIGHAAPIYAVFAKHNTLYTASGDKFVARWNIDELKQDNFALKSESSNYAISMFSKNVIILSSFCHHLKNVQILFFLKNQNKKKLS